jgi:hypothetical protein
MVPRLSCPEQASHAREALFSSSFLTSRALGYQAVFRPEQAGYRVRQAEFRAGQRGFRAVQAGFRLWQADIRL